MMCSVPGWGKPSYYYTQMHQSQDIVAAGALHLPWPMNYSIAFLSTISYTTSKRQFC